MWAQSSSGWNDADMSMTPDAVTREHENMSCLNVYLAIRGDEVIGYCSLSRFSKDPTALFIGLLNVRPDHQGCGVGKALVLRCVDRTRELGYDQLDLYTWPGNTKAVPLYKKYGFFWERREDTTHLMNFIPAVLQTPLLQGFFDDDTWYTCSTRPLDVVPDGRKENGFEFFRYSWNRQGRRLDVEFERTGRGICSIETDDYRIAMSVDYHELVFGQDYSIRFCVENKSGKPLSIRIQGRDDGCIRFSYEEEFQVERRLVTEGTFSIAPIERDVDSWERHPAVTAAVTVNGQPANFRLGVSPKFPVVAELRFPGGVCHLGSQQLAYLDLNVFLTEPTEFFVHLPESALCSWHEAKPKAVVSGRGRLSIPIAVDVHAYGGFRELVTIQAVCQSGSTIEFQRGVNFSFRGVAATAVYPGDETYSISDGIYACELNLRSNRVRVSRLRDSSDPLVWSFPRLGRPFDDEFSSTPPDNVTAWVDKDGAHLRARLKSQAFAGLTVTIAARLASSGFLQHWYEVVNTNQNEAVEGVCLSDTFHFACSKGMAPIRSEIVSVDPSVEDLTGSWNSEDLTENWLFAEEAGRTSGLVWDPQDTLVFGGWEMFFEHSWSHLAPGQTVKTRPVTLALDSFPDWQRLREYALQRHERRVPVSTRPVDVCLNGGNPFVVGDYRASLVDRRRVCGRMTAVVEGHHLAAGESVVLESPQQDCAAVVAYSVGDGTLYFDRQAAVFAVDDTRSVAIQAGTRDGCDVLTADNGVLRIASAAGFGPNLISLCSEEGEWLDTSFPRETAKAWWNPWLGGIGTAIRGLSLRALLREEAELSETKLRDAYGSEWSGLVSTVTITDCDDFRGLALRFHYVLRPGCPVLACVPEVVQETGRYMADIRLETEAFLCGSAANWERHSMRFDVNRQNVRLQAGSEQRFFRTDGPLTVSTVERSERLTIYGAASLWECYAGVSRSFAALEAVARIEGAHGTRFFGPPMFFIVTRTDFSGEALAVLDGVTFST